MALQKMSSTALVAANFVERVNCLINIMNSNDPKTKHKWKKPYLVKRLINLKNWKVLLSGLNHSVSEAHIILKK